MDTVKFLLVVMLTYAMVHTISSVRCKWSCGRLSCGLRCYGSFGKRGVGSSLPCGFKTFDLDGNGLITKKELDSVLNSIMKNHTMKATFYMMDRNEDSVIDKDEFKNGPLACAQGMEKENKMDDPTFDNMDKELTEFEIYPI
ncbi:hypothetical protein KUTeg_015077 [Tegillarca granosa]|uniref:EF-hand domain-containing protein n=1 Tax=Tegillarca granosa TaxID=220873 RepID=A0ABQ9EP31_TEGGR|nr:hypothetical protein KUTeg_015077 [Tegillarca granosa]